MPQRVLSEGEFNTIKDALLKAAPEGLTEEQFHRWIGPRLDGAIAEAENSNAPVSGGALRRLLQNAGSVLNPITIAQGAAHAVMNPGDTYNALVDASADQFNKARDAFGEGRFVAGVGHGAAGVLPGMGPAAADTGEQIRSGDIAGGLGALAGVLVPFGAARAVRARVASQARRGVPATLEREAAQQVSQRVLAPGNVRFKGKAETIAPEILQRGMRGGREVLSEAADEGMLAAGTRIDDAIAAGGGQQSGVVLDPIVARLLRKIDDLTINGEPIKGAEGRVAGLRARIDQLERTAKTKPQQSGIVPAGQAPPPTRALSFEDLRKYRDEQYRLADEARAYERAGNPALSDEGFAARETGSAIRQEFADLSPDLAAANADYTFFKTLGDVLDPAQGRPKVTAPSQGITGGAATSGAVAGSLISPKVAFALAVVRPWIQRMRSEPAWQLADAHSKMRLADAIRRGDVPTAQKLMVRISQGAVVTSPSEYRSQTRGAGSRAAYPVE